MFRRFRFAFQIGETARGDGIRGFAQQVLDSTEVAAEIGQGLRKSFVRRGANAVLLQATGGGEHRATAGPAVHGLSHPEPARLPEGFDLPTQFGARRSARSYQPATR